MRQPKEYTYLDGKIDGLKDLLLLNPRQEVFPRSAIESYIDYLEFRKEEAKEME